VQVGEEVLAKDDVTPEAVVALAERAGIVIAPEHVDVIALRLRELFDLAAPLEEADVADVEVSQPFDPRWTDKGTA
jgi:hypothetical protein